MGWFDKTKEERKFKEGEIVGHKLMAGHFIIIGDNINDRYFPRNSYEVRNNCGEVFNLRECEIKKYNKDNG